MTDEKQAIDAAVEQFRSLMESQLARAKKFARIRTLPTLTRWTPL